MSLAIYNVETFWDRAWVYDNLPQRGDDTRVLWILLVILLMIHSRLPRLYIANDAWLVLIVIHIGREN